MEFVCWRWFEFGDFHVEVACGQVFGMDEERANANLIRCSVNPDQRISHQHSAQAKSLESKISCKSSQNDDRDGVTGNSLLDAFGRILMLYASGGQGIVTRDRLRAHAHEDPRHTGHLIRNRKLVEPFIKISLTA